MRGKFLRPSILGLKGFCGTHGGSIAIITFLLFNWGWSDKDDWKAKWRLKDEMTTEGRWRVRFPIQTDEWRIVFRTREKWAPSDWLSAFSISLGMKIYFAPLRCVNLSGYIGVIVNNRPKWAETHYLVLCYLRFFIFFIFTAWGQKEFLLGTLPEEKINSNR